MRECGRPLRRSEWTRYVVSYPRLSRLKRRNGRGYFLFCARAGFRAEVFELADRAAVFRRGAGAARFFAAGLAAGRALDEATRRGSAVGLFTSAGRLTSTVDR